MTAQKDQDAPRRPGRPRGKKPGTANREQLMDIALTLFARDGAGRVSLNAIAKEAGVTPALLHYYFSSREALVTQLIEERFKPLRNHISRIFVDHPQDPVLALTMMVETLGHMAEKNAWFAPLWMRENGTSTRLITVVNSSSGASAGLIFPSCCQRRTVPSIT